MKGKRDGPPQRGYARRPDRELVQIPTATLRAGRVRVYVAASLPTYDTAHYAEAMREIRACLPDVEFVEARTTFIDSSDWRRRWRHVLASLDGLIVIVHPDGTVGAGVLQEILDARLIGRPVLVFVRGRIRPIAQHMFRFVEPANPRRFASVAPSGVR